MSGQRCRYLMDISPYPALCDNPTYYYDGGPTEAHCEGCEGYATDPRETNVTLREIDIDPECASEWMVDRYAVFDAVYRCECGETFGHVAKNRPKYCPACGAKVYTILRKVD